MQTLIIQHLQFKTVSDPTLFDDGIVYPLSCKKFEDSDVLSGC